MWPCLPCSVNWASRSSSGSKLARTSLSRASGASWARWGLGAMNITAVLALWPIPTVSPSTIPLVYYHINSFQQASSVERPLPRGENRTAGRASHHEELCSDWVVSPHVWTTGLSLIAVWGLIGATPRDQPWTPAVTLPHRRDGAERAADGGVVYVPRALSVSPRAPRIHAQRGARFDPYNTHNCLPPKKLRREIQ